jgi:hypothetical protein
MASTATGTGVLTILAPHKLSAGRRDVGTERVADRGGNAGLLQHTGEGLALGSGSSR